MSRGEAQEQERNEMMKLKSGCCIHEIVFDMESDRGDQRWVNESEEVDKEGSTT